MPVIRLCSLPASWECRANACGSKRDVTYSCAGGSIDGVGHCRCGRDSSGLASADGRLIGAVDKYDLDLGNLGEGQDRVRLPVAAGDAVLVERDFLQKRAAERLDDIPFDLIAHTIW